MVETKKNKITSDTTLEEILEHPELRDILLKYNLPCFGCPFAALEMGVMRIGEVCKMYGINLEELLKELNEEINK